jgi:hypothetical protein
VEAETERAWLAIAVAMTDDAIINYLAHGPLHRFADWPNPEVRRVAIGISSILARWRVRTSASLAGTAKRNWWQHRRRAGFVSSLIV